MPVVLNVGGGSKQIPIPPHYAGWEHQLLDIDPAGRPDVCLDARQLHTLPAATYDAIYCSHNLEHYHRHDGARVLDGFRHILKPEGFAEIHVPDLLAVMRAVVERRMDIDDELYRSPAGPILVRDVLYGYHVEIERSGQDFYAHKTGFSPQSLVRFVLGRGFTWSAVATVAPFGIVGYFFKSTPTAEQRRMLSLPAQDPAPQAPQSPQIGR